MFVGDEQSGERLMLQHHEFLHHLDYFTEELWQEGRNFASQTPVRVPQNYYEMRKATKYHSPEYDKHPVYGELYKPSFIRYTDDARCQEKLQLVRFIRFRERRNARK